MTTGISISSYEKMIPAEHFPGGLFNVYAGRSYSKQVVVYHLPFTGTIELLWLQPGTFFSGRGPEVTVSGSSITFEIVRFFADPDYIKREASEKTGLLRQCLIHSRNDVDAFNAALPGQIAELFSARKQRILDNNNLLASLGVPIKKQDNLPQTYAIPTLANRKPVAVRPTVVESGYRAEPTLDDATYQDILKIIHDLGKVFERLPDTYSGKSEEALRDHFLLYLAPRYQSAAGEAFNKSGKTDILIRHEDGNAFIAECKFWGGQKQYLATITQLLGYLTWRDSKAAVIIFVRNKEFSTVLSTIEQTSPTHTNFLSSVGKTEDAWFNFRFHINDDRNREVKLAVLVFHIPH